MGIFAAAIGLGSVLAPSTATATPSTEVASLTRPTWERLVGTPPVYGDSAMAYDSARRRTVLFGGYLPYDESLDYYGGETWEWNGRTWAEEHSRSGDEPPPRLNAAMAYDAARKQVVLFGGTALNSPSALADTWTRDGTTWTDATPEASPSPRTATAIAYDAARKRVVLFGGARGGNARFGDTWEWDGAKWRQRRPSMSPPVRARHALAYDARRRRLVLFGGVDPSGEPLHDTWEWNGTTWKRRAPAVAPAGSYRSTAAYDSQRGRVVLVTGGGETWEWDGTTWARRRLRAAPPGGDAAAAYDAARERVVLYGGGTSDPERRGGTWEYDGVQWRSRLPRSASAIAYDARRQRVVLLSDDEPRETWVLSGTTWQQRHPRVSPGGGAVTMAYDEACGCVLLFLAHSYYVAPETWTWDGTTWRQLHPPTVPTSRNSGMRMTYDAARRRVVLFGGWAHISTDEGDIEMNDTWEWDGTTWVERTSAVSPPPTSDAPMAYDAARQRVVIFGHGQAYDGQTWLWDGVNWELRRPHYDYAPPARDGAAMAYDPVRTRIVLSGGRYIGGGFDLYDTWEWDGGAWSELSVDRAPPSTDLMVYDAALGEMVLFANGAGGTWVYRPGAGTG